MSLFANRLKNITVMTCTTLILTGCAIVRPGEVGVKQRLGKLDTTIQEPGPVLINPFVTRVVMVPTRTMNLEVELSLPSKEGLNVNSVISILYKIDRNQAPDVIRNVGSNYEDVLILSVFRSAASDVCAKFYAKDMHSGNRSVIEQQIQDSMDAVLKEYGFEVEAVLLKSISLPQGLYRAIEDKLEAEQNAQRMDFVIQQTQKEAEQKKIEAAGIRDANLILSEGITPSILQWRNLEVMSEFAESPNGKIIFTNGDVPTMLSVDSED
jgi:regulator of protease activity HflC (stomatin/prohibitin superfamily)